MKRLPRPRRGFTLIELLMVVALLGIIGLLVAPSMQDMLARQRVQSITSELMTDIHLARSEATQRSRPVRMVFGTNASMTCYTIHTTGVVGNCNCTKAQGTACLRNDGTAWPGITELKTVQIPRSTTVTVAATPATSITFDLPQLLPNRPDFRMTVSSSRGGQLRAATNLTGRPTMCSPDGSMSGAPACP
ncbi:MAG: GspH/FimT family pseudopilin [Aquabacterium sp.]